MNLQERIKKRRADLTLEEAAIESGIPFQTLSRLERGAVPSYETFRRLMGWLGISREEWWRYLPKDKVAQ